ncbi:hypothetical protein [Desulfosporosinus sp.]|nr:hypothetical protein [Desulfosporosinus sp.]
MAAIFQYTLWTYKMIVTNIPWWLWVLIVIAIVVKLFARRVSKKR